MTVQPKKITAGRVLAWVVGIYMILNGFALIFTSSYLAGLVYLMGGILIAPPTNNVLKDRFNTIVSGGLKILIFFLVILFTIVYSINSVVENTNTASTFIDNSEPIQQKENIRYIEISASAKNWDADANPDGLELTIRPKSEDGKFIKSSGQINATLYSQIYEYDLTPRRGPWILNWHSTMSIEDCDWFGCTIRLPKEDFAEVVEQFDLGIFGILEVSLITPQGEKFKAVSDTVSLR